MLPVKKLRLGVAGLGRAYQAMAPAFADPRLEVVAGTALQEIPFPGKFFHSVEELCRADLDVVYVATPHPLHAEHACLAAAHGKHVLVEKPMATSLEEARRMIDAARKAGVLLIVGHSHSFDLPVKRTAELIRSGAYGKLRMITALNFTDFLTRRRREPYDTAVLNQGAHQVDIARLLARERIVSVQAHAAGMGAYAALLGFEGGACASLVYSGHGHFDSDELMGGVGEMGSPQHHQHFGFLVASCERADLRPLPDGVMIYEGKTQRLERLPPPERPRAEVIDELYESVVNGKAALHDGEWGMATLEACLAMQDRIAQ
jgi:phthalate 4,5-cis-dihydrodiol dehydrogenase